MTTYSQAGQDLFVLSLLKDSKEKTFIDIGCYEPIELNNTYLLELNGWDGISIDILDLTTNWSIRKTKFINSDAFNINYKELIDTYFKKNVVDYLNVDIEGDGSRYKALEAVISSGCDFKIITVEHDMYRGFFETETKPQRELLYSLGYELVCSNVMLSNNIFEDWWLNPKYFNRNDYEFLVCESTDYNEIIKKLKL